MKALKYFTVKSKRNLVDITCLFSTFDATIENETKSLFAFLFFQSKANIRLNLGNIKNISQEDLFRIIEFGRELFIEKRHLVLLHPPVGIARYVRRFGLDSVIRLAKD